MAHLTSRGVFCKKLFLPAVFNLTWREFYGNKIA